MKISSRFLSSWTFELDFLYERFYTNKVYYHYHLSRNMAVTAICCQTIKLFQNSFLNKVTYFYHSSTLSHLEWAQMHISVFKKYHRLQAKSSLPLWIPSIVKWFSFSTLYANIAPGTKTPHSSGFFCEITQHESNLKKPVVFPSPLNL